MEKQKADRLNSLNEKQKAAGLTGAEKEEQRLLHTEYLSEILAGDGDEADQD